MAVVQGADPVKKLGGPAWGAGVGGGVRGPLGSVASTIEGSDNRPLSTNLGAGCSSCAKSLEEAAVAGARGKVGYVYKKCASTF